MLPGFCFLLGWKRDQTKLQELQEALAGFLKPLPITQTGPAFASEISRRDGDEAHQEGPEFEREIWRNSRKMMLLPAVAYALAPLPRPHL